MNQRTRGPATLLLFVHKTANQAQRLHLFLQALQLGFFAMKHFHWVLHRYLLGEG